jgi:hypothetical protein
MSGKLNLVGISICGKSTEIDDKTLQILIYNYCYSRHLSGVIEGRRRKFLSGMTFDKILAFT